MLKNTNLLIFKNYETLPNKLYEVYEFEKFEGLNITTLIK